MDDLAAPDPDYVRFHWLTSGDVQERYGVAPRTITERCRRQLWHSVKLPDGNGRKVWYIDPDAVERFVGGQRLRAEASGELTRLHAVPDPSGTGAHVDTVDTVEARVETRPATDVDERIRDLELRLREAEIDKRKLQFELDASGRELERARAALQDGRAEVEEYLSEIAQLNDKLAAARRRARG